MLTPQPGPVLVLGGGLSDRHHGLWRAVVQAAGGAGARVLVLPTASDHPEASAHRLALRLQRWGAVPEVLPLAPCWAGSGLAQARALAQQAGWPARLAGAGALFLTGGEQERLMDVLRPQGRPSALLRAIRQWHARGGCVAGTSAGAAVLSDTAIRALYDPFDALLRPLGPTELGLGFGLLPSSLVVDQHFLRRGRIARLVRVLLQSGRCFGLGVDEASAVQLAAGELSAVGARGGLLVDASQARQTGPTGPLQVAGLRLTHLPPGHRLLGLDAWVTWRGRPVAPASDGRSAGPTHGPTDGPAPQMAWGAGPATPGSVPATQPSPPLAAEPTGQPATQPPIRLRADLLRDGVLLRAMARAAAAPGRVVRVLARREGDAVGFEWLFCADTQTRTWPARGPGTPGLLQVRLDIRPLAHPAWPGPPA